MVKIKRIAKKYYFRQIVCCWMIFCMAFILPVKIAMADPNPLAGALPSGDSGSGYGIVAGAADLDINAADGAIINWENFDIGSAMEVQFHQGGAGNSVLNRVTGAGATGIMGTLGADGRVFVINPAGVVLGPNASFNVNQLVASSLNMSDDAFSDVVAGGDMVFTEDPAFDGIVTNNASNFTAERIYLIGRQVINNGTLLADECVVMAAGNSVIISDTDGVVGVEVTMGPDWESGGDLYQVGNAGGINVDGGAIGPGGPENPAQVVLAAGDIWSSAYIHVQGAGSASLIMDAKGTVTIDGDGQESVVVIAVPDYDNYDPCSPNVVVASIDIEAGSDIAVTTDVVAHARGAYGDGEFNSEATIKVNQRRAEDGLGFGDLNVIARDPYGDMASITAYAGGGPENTANILICADDVTVEAEGTYNSDVDWAYDSYASIQAMAGSMVAGPQNHTASVEIGAKGSITVRANSETAETTSASISAEAINGEENTASVLLCANDDVQVIADIGDEAFDMPGFAAKSHAFIKSLAGANVATNNNGNGSISALFSMPYSSSLSEATTTVISHNGSVLVSSQRKGEEAFGVASIDSEILGRLGTATTQVFGKDVDVTGVDASIKVSKTEGMVTTVISERGDGYCLATDGAVMEIGPDGTLIIDGSGSALCPDCPPCDCDPEIDPVAAPIPFRIPRIEGCPELTIAAAMELGINSDTIQIAIGNALALNPNIQPCEACESLVDASNILRDEDGSRMAAMLAAFNAQASPGAPFTPEMQTSMTMALVDASQGAQYASSVAEYIDAFVLYVAVLDTELGAPVGDSVAFVLDKYGEGVSANDDIAAFVASRIANMEVFGG